MAPRWTFQTTSWGRPGYTVLEGSASRGDQHAEYFLVVGEAHVSLDIQSLRRVSDEFLELLAPFLGRPDAGPAVVNVGELMDSLDEAPVNASWAISPARRGELLRALERLLQSDGCASVRALER
ncbi:MAG TPA: hypothetical protein VLG48_05485 [Candidatus Methylomirabilis sp.]|nr:hypothetical protein [Candidatus Methylomirabilis sp.]